MFILVLSACGAEDITITAPALVEPVIPVVRMDSAIAARGPVMEVTRVTGQVNVESVPVSFGSTTGGFYRHAVSLGQEVSAGQLLAQLSIIIQDIQVDSVETVLENVRRRHSHENSISSINIELMADSGAISRARLELQLAREQQALEIRNLEAQLDNFRQGRAARDLHAPIDGVITRIGPQSFGVQVPPFTPVVYITAHDAVPFVEYLGTSNPAHLLLGAKRILAHAGGEVYEVERIHLTRSQIARHGGQTLWFSFNTGNPPTVGSLVGIYIYYEWVEDALRIPRGALLHDEDMGYYVHVIGDAGLEQVFVTVGAQTQTYIEILGGLAEGDEVHVR